MNSLDEFYINVGKLSGAVSQSDEKIKHLVTFFESKLTLLYGEFLKNKQSLSERYGDSVVVDLVEEIGSHVARSLKGWESRQLATAKSQGLRGLASDSLLVIIYGKVKAGKSTLGNYVAQQCPADVVPNFFTFDKAGNRSSAPKLEELADGSFATKSTECTSSIQGFEIPGLTWIDTPGLASMTSENGALAREYVEAADLIIYPTSSDSPGRHTDTNELRELAKMGKEFCVLITKSDYEDEDEVDGELVSVLKNKSAADREKQEEYVRSEIFCKLAEISEDHGIKAENHLHGDVLSLSIMAAREYPEGSPQWLDSNIEAFYKMLNRILETDAVRLRAEQPLKNVAAFFRDCLLSKQNQDSLVHKADSLRCIQEDLSKRFLELKSRASELVTRCLEDVNLDVQEIIANAVQAKISGKVIEGQVGAKVAQRIAEVVEPAAKEVLAEFANKMDAEFELPPVEDGGLDIGEKTQTITVTNEVITRATGGGIGAIVGGLLGLALGFIGSVVGAAVGGGIGSAVGNACSSTSSKEIVVGDNRQDVEDRALNIAREATEKGVTLALLSFEEQVIHPISQAVEGMQQEFETTIEQLEKELRV